MLRTIFDTNIYGLILLESELDRIREEISRDNQFLVYGFRPIRQELRDTPHHLRYGHRSTRSLLLSLYDEITKERFLENIPDILKLAEAFYKEYKKNKGTKRWKDIKSDFLIVAFGCIHKLDVVVSDDSKTLRSTKALEAYNAVAAMQSIRLPTMFKYSEIRKRYKF